MHFREVDFLPFQVVFLLCVQDLFGVIVIAVCGASALRNPYSNFFSRFCYSFVIHPRSMVGTLTACLVACSRPVRQSQCAEQ
jgi:hypothetical protein